MSLGHFAPHSPHEIPELRCRICDATVGLALSASGDVLCEYHRGIGSPDLKLRCRICHGTDDVAPDQYGMMLCGRHRAMSNKGLSNEAQHAQRWAIALWVAAAAAMVAGAVIFAHAAHASMVSYYATQGGGSEASALVSTAPTTLSLASACNYDTGNPKVAMIFDAKAAPSAGAVPQIAPLALPAASSANLPSCASFALPRDGVQMLNGIWVGCSTTAKTLTLDSGANCSFWVSR